MKLVELPINKIIPSVFQPRETFDKEELQELADSMKEHGLINPISVKENGDGTYQIIAGERRWRAAKFAKRDKIYAIVKEVTDEQQRLESLIENIHRTDLNIIEKGRGMMEIFKIHGIDLTPKVISGKIGAIRRGTPIPKLGSLEEKILDVYTKIHLSPRSIETWLDSISANEDVITDHLKTPEKERIAEDIIARVATIEDKSLQKKTYTKIKKQELSSPQASKFVTKIKKLPEIKQEIALTTDIPIEVISEETDEEEIKLPKKELEKKYRQRMAQKLLTIDSKPFIPPTPKHIDDIPNSQLYIERNLWNVQKFIEEINLFTIGTDDKQLKQVIDLITQIKVNKKNKQLILIDTRDTPYSQFKPEFNKTSLENALLKIGVRYKHSQKLGVPKDLRTKLFSGEISENELWNHYESNILTDETRKFILQIIDDDNIPIFLCTEISPIRCHRHVIANWLEKEKNLISWDL